MVFDTRSKMVMSQGGTAERMKEKVRRVHKEPAFGEGLIWKRYMRNILCNIMRFLILQVQYFQSVLMDLLLSLDIHFH